MRGASLAAPLSRRAAVLGVVLSMAPTGLAVTAGAHVRRLLGSTTDAAPPPEHGLEVLCAGGASLAAAWLALLLLGGAACARGRQDPVRRAAESLAPHLTARVAAALIGSVALVGGAGAAHAAAPLATPVGAEQPTRAAAPAPRAPGTHDSGQPSTAATATLAATEDVPDPGWRPTSPPDRRAAEPAAIALVSRGSAEPDSVTVRSGDTLWAIAARHLGPNADAAAIAEEWPRWHEANREAIGDDPDLLLPGTVLVPPENAARGVAS